MPDPYTAARRAAAVTERRPRRRRTAPPSAWAPLLLVAAAAVYNDWLLEFVLPTGLDARHSYVSELYAADQPFHRLFGGIEVVAATLVISGALLARRRTPGGPATAGWWALVAFGVFSVADVVVPMHCAPSVESPCEAVNPWHTTTSALVHAALFASMALLIIAARPGRPLWPEVGRRGPWVLASALTTALATVGPLFGRPGWHGVPQRAHLVLVGVWFLLLATALRAEARRDGNRAVGVGSGGRPAGEVARPASG
ncbi:hypothetical protein BLA24_11550 [Streptomyces cinnamoneus]|uniref:Uncharacterized protein n=1 Tax=Streptomyces cinnamoneus TaxID=53446 RepID=A0A2G1XKF6_STRCJ|nr:DUF998 domain-containing protein [Streptomyces cinnamoneus]PHQ51718.1 hypothetical protein BLA24_11550 [Streptomyces cinnamoneus]PPT11967.1 DUF998 domain-containing protein [Streptomyces cinnamoneus]